MLSMHAPPAASLRAALVTSAVLSVFCARSAAAQTPILSADVQGTLVTIEWTSVPGAEAYDVVVTGSVSGSVTLPSAPTRYVINAPPGVYTLQVRGRAGTLLGPFSNAVTVNVGAAPPCPPIDRPTLSASVQGTVVTLAWTPVPGAIGYRLEGGRLPGATEASHTVGPGVTSVSANAGSTTGTFYARVMTSNGCSTSVSNEVTITLSGGAPVPPAPGPGPRTPDPPPGTRLPLPSYGPAVVEAVANAYPAALRNSCGNHEWLFRLVLALRQYDTRWGLNWKRGVVGDMSEDIVTYNFGPGPDEGTTSVYIIDVIHGHCGSNPGPTWIDQTEATRRAGTIGRWTLQPLLRVLDALR
jgi:hypothetical protein